MPLKATWSFLSLYILGLDNKPLWVNHLPYSHNDHVCQLVFLTYVMSWFHVGLDEYPMVLKVSVSPPKIFIGAALSCSPTTWQKKSWEEWKHIRKRRLNPASVGVVIRLSAFGKLQRLSPPPQYLLSERRLFDDKPFVWSILRPWSYPITNESWLLKSH